MILDTPAITIQVHLNILLSTAAKNVHDGNAILHGSRSLTHTTYDMRYVKCCGRKELLRYDRLMVRISS